MKQYEEAPLSYSIMANHTSTWNFSIGANQLCVANDDRLFYTKKCSE